MTGPLTAAAITAQQETAASALRVGEALAEYAEAADLGMLLVVKNRAGAILHDIAIASPVDTGRFRAAWGPGFAALGTVAPPVPPVNPSGSATSPTDIVQGSRQGSASITSTEHRHEVLVANGVRYGPFLEAGFSPQASSGFVRRVLNTHAARLREAVERLRVPGK